MMNDELKTALNSSFIIPHSSFISAPEEVDGDAGGEDGEAEGAVEGVVVEGRGDDERAGGGEERGGEGVAGDAEARAFARPAPAEDEERERRQPEPAEV